MDRVRRKIHLAAISLEVIRAAAIKEATKMAGSRDTIHTRDGSIKAMETVMAEIHMAAVPAVRETCAVIYGVQIRYVNAWEAICVHVSKIR